MGDKGCEFCAPIVATIICTSARINSRVPEVFDLIGEKLVSIGHHVFSPRLQGHLAPSAIGQVGCTEYQILHARTATGCFNLSYSLWGSWFRGPHI
eukprot:scaffold9345_cov120-Cylindrotheca_fusiformis.AAC.9